MKKSVKFILTVLLLSVSVSGAWAMGSMVMMKDPLVGKSAPDFTLATLDGEKNFTETRAGQKAIVFFWATWCPHCREALTDLNTRKDELAQKNIALVLVDVGEKKEEVAAHLNRQNIKFNVFLDERSEVSEYYKIIGVPTLFFVDAAGIVRDVQHGLPDDLDPVFN